MSIPEIIQLNTTEISQPNLFPFPFPHHLGFCCVAMLFFAYMYVRYKKPYQLIMAAAIPFSLVIWLSTSRTLFYGVGITEVALLLTAIVTTIIHKKKHPELYAEPSKDEESTESTSETEQEEEKSENE